MDEKHVHDRFQLAIESAAVGFWDWDIGTQVVFFSRTFRTLLGFNDDEFPDLYDSWESRLHPADVEPTRAAIQRHLEERDDYDVEYRLKLKSGKFRWFRACGQAIWDEHGTAYRMAGSITDVHDRVAVQRALEDSQRLYLSLVEDLPVYLIRKDIEGRFTFCNEAFCELLDKSRDEIIGSTDFDHFPADLATKYRHDDQLVMRKQVRFEDVEGSSDGDQRGFFQVIKTPVINSYGVVIGCQAVFWDVTERELAAEAKERARQAAEAANRSKSEFLANMSHEIRTPLNAIIGMTELVLESELSLMQREYLTTVQESGESLLSIINEVLDFSKIEAGRLELDPINFDLPELIGNAMRLMAVRAHAKRLELAVRIAEDVPHFVTADAKRLRQVIINLVGNAIKFTPSGEVLLLVSKQSQGTDRVVLQFAVQDTGIGIANEQISRVFDAFEQGDTSTTRQYGGTGLGLAISARLVHLMGGELNVESKADQGSVFSFTIEAQLVGGQARQIDPDAVQGQSVIVVEDNETTRSILEEIVCSWGMAATCVANATDALTALRLPHNAEALLITDLVMPEADGYELVRSIRDDPELAGTKVILLSSGSSADAMLNTKLRISASLLKPVKPSELFDAIVVALGRPLVAEELIEDAAAMAQVESLNILLAEDGLANQQLAVGMLNKLGHQVTVANNGQEAVDKWRQHRFDLILMDVQMPEMDGIQATQFIRRNENVAAHIPIIAVTAHAMVGDEKKCRDAGMDGYLSKPFKRAALVAALQPHTRPTSVEASGMADDSTHSSESSLDVSTALEYTDGDTQMLRVVLESYLREVPELISGLKDAAAAGDAKNGRRFAHTIKGTTRLFPNSPVRSIAAAIEEMMAAQQFDSVMAQIDDLQSNWLTLSQQLQGYLGH